MGLSLYYATKDYEYDCETDTYKGDYDFSFDIGYFGYKNFRDKLLEFVTNGKVDGDSLFINGIIQKSNTPIVLMKKEEQQKLLCYCWLADDNGYKVLMKREDFGDEKITNEKQEYLDKLEKIKNIYPKVYDLYPFVFHSDCDGYILKEQLINVLPILKECKLDKYFKDEYEEFLDFLIDTITKVIKTDGKLMFS